MPPTGNTDSAPPGICSETPINITVAGKQLEAVHISGISRDAATILFLHEGLGSVSLWRDFPRRVVAATGCAAFVYSRYGYGQSEALAEARAPDYMHREAQYVLPALLEKINITNPILFGHSDGASIALIHAGSGHSVAGLILEAPHVFVETISLQGVATAAQTYRSTDLATKLGRHHRNADKTFWGWHDIWANDKFRDWNIESFLPSIECPTLLIQGAQDDYGSAAQVDAIANRITGSVSKHLLENCGHSPHRDQCETVLELVRLFVRTV
jgi:pimeloyl-ACP methyl ester carboxylesterase